MCLQHSYYQTAPQKKKKPATGLPRYVAINVAIFGKVSKANARWTAKLRSKFLLNRVPGRTYSELFKFSCCLRASPLQRKASWRIDAVPPCKICLAGVSCKAAAWFQLAQDTMMRYVTGQWLSWQPPDHFRKTSLSWSYLVGLCV
jgi:hypothetical protein